MRPFKSFLFTAFILLSLGSFGQSKVKISEMITDGDSARFGQVPIVRNASNYKRRADSLVYSVIRYADSIVGRIHRLDTLEVRKGFVGPGLFVGPYPLAVQTGNVRNGTPLGSALQVPGVKGQNMNGSFNGAIQTSTAGVGSTVSILGGAGGDYIASSAAPTKGIGGAGGLISLAAGAGGTGVDVGGTGAFVNIIAGSGGIGGNNVNPNYTGGSGGAIFLTSGAGGQGAGTGSGAAGGAITLSTGAGGSGFSGANGGNSGAITVSTGAGGAGGTGTGGSTGALTFSTGAAGVTTSGGVTNVPGVITFKPGLGAKNSTSGVAGPAAYVAIEAGNSQGGTNMVNYGGNVYINGGKATGTANLYGFGGIVVVGHPYLAGGTTDLTPLYIGDTSRSTAGSARLYVKGNSKLSGGIVHQMIQAQVNYIATANDYFIKYKGAAAITLTLPTGPNNGATLKIANGSATGAITFLSGTIHTANGATISTLSPGAWIELVYLLEELRWEVMASGSF
jgi:hypothetical protein